MCYILCTTSSSVFYVALDTQGGLRGGRAAPPSGFEANALKKFVLPRETCHIFSSFFASPRYLCPLLGDFSSHGFFYGFLFLVKQLGFLTNPSHWVRVLDVTGSYVYIVL